MKSIHKLILLPYYWCFLCHYLEFVSSFHLYYTPRTNILSKHRFGIQNHARQTTLYSNTSVTQEQQTQTTKLSKKNLELDKEGSQHQQQQLPKNNKNGDKNNTNDRLLGILVLLTVPLSWGTYAPVVKYVYEMDPPVPGFVFSGGYYFLAAFTLSLLSFLQQKMAVDSSSSARLSRYEQNAVLNEDENKNVTPSHLEEEINKSKSIAPNFKVNQLLGGVELGSYLFIGNCLQVVGLKTVPADRAAFLVQLTTIMVPLFQAGFAGDIFSIPIVTWIACILAFMGVIIMGLDVESTSTLSSSGFASVDISSIMSNLGNISFTNGDLLIITAAVAYTMHVIRLSRYAQFTTPLGLAASKAGVEAFLSIALISFLCFFGGQSSASTDASFLNEMSTEITTYFQTIQYQIQNGLFPPAGSTKVIGAILWTGWITCAYTIYAQSFGQKRVSPTDANLIYSMQPLFSALFAFILLGESLGPAGFVGGLLIASALWIVTASRAEEESISDISDIKDLEKVEL